MKDIPKPHIVPRPKFKIGDVVVFEDTEAEMAIRDHICSFAFAACSCGGLSVYRKDGKLPDVFIDNFEFKCICCPLCGVKLDKNKP